MTATTTRIGVGHAHAKAILMGEHAVVYGAPALAVPVPELVVTAVATEAPPSSDEVGIALTTASPLAPPVAVQASEGLRRMTAHFRKVAGVERRGRPELLIHCAIPQGCGLGSSAACARAAVLALADLFAVSLAERTVFDLVQIAENLAHGRSSGVDAVATGATRPLIFTNGTVEELRIGVTGCLVIADSGRPGRTKDAVAGLRQRFERDPGAQAEFVAAVSRVTRAAVRDLAEGRLAEVGARLSENHELLRKVGLSTDQIDALVEIALAAGSLGAKLSGGGLGGCLLALVPEPQHAERVARRLSRAGAVRTWIVPLERS